MSDVNSNDPKVKVTPEVMASNVLFMGLPSNVIPQADADDFSARHGWEYAAAFFAALAGYGVMVEGVTA